MRTLKCQLKKSTAIILCIVLTLSAMCTFAHVENRETRNTQFFAAQIPMATAEGQATHELEKSLYTFVCWVNPFEMAFVENSASNHGSLIPANALLIAGKIPCTKAETAPCQKVTEYFMRI